MSAADGMMLWTDAYLADTSHLTTLQHGAYLLILMAMWRGAGTLPNDEARLARVAGLPLDRWRKIAPEVMELLTLDGERVTQKRLRREWKRTAGLIEKKREAARAGGVAKALKFQDAGLAHGTSVAEQKVADAPETQTQTQTETETETENQNHTHTDACEFETFWTSYPRRDGDNPKAPARATFDALVRGGVSPDLIVAGARRYADNARRRGIAGTRFVAQAVTWLSQQRFADDADAQGRAQGAPGAMPAPVSFEIRPATPEWAAWWRYHDTHRNAYGASFGLTQMTRADDTRQPYVAPSQWPPGHEVSAEPDNPHDNREPS